MVAEIFGRYWMTFGPGLRWIPYRIAKSRAQPSRRTHIYPLFTQPRLIDFKGGGAAVPKEGRALTRMIPPDREFLCMDRNGHPVDISGNYVCPDAPYRATYIAPEDLPGAVISLVENAARSYINSLNDREAMEEGGAGFDVMQKMKEKDSDTVNQHANNVHMTLLEWGMELLPVKVIFQDFDLSKETLEARYHRYQAAQKRKAAADVAAGRSVEISGTLIGALARITGLTKADVQRSIRDNNELAKSCLAFTQDMITRLAAIDGKSLTDIRVNGSEGGVGLIEAIAAFRRLAPEAS